MSLGKIRGLFRQLSAVKEKKGPVIAGTAGPGVSAAIVWLVLFGYLAMKMRPDLSIGQTAAGAHWSEGCVRFVAGGLIGSKVTVSRLSWEKHRE